MAAKKPNHYKLLLRLVFLSVWIIGVTGQQLLLHDAELVTQCTQGLIRNIDRFVVTGEVNAWGVDTLNWQHINYVNSKGDIQQTICFVDITKCSNAPADGCYCVDVGDGKFKVVMNQTATLDYSNAMVKLTWITEDRSQYKETRVVQLPKVYDQGQQSLFVKVNGRERYVTSHSCILPFEDRNNTLTLCCKNSPSPCTAKISHGSKSVTVTGQNCVDYISVCERQCDCNCNNCVCKASLGRYTFTQSMCGGAYSGTLDCAAIKIPHTSASDDYHNLRPWTIAMTLLITVVDAVLRTS